ncbi:MAG TPA: hypothetical protein PL143_14480 [Rhodocyclaceae bacterium]|nr:hypothetical protein [Rhodocyclaceae bacterium]
MSKDQSAQDPLEFVRGMWNSMGFSLPGMVAPTLDTDELDKRIGDLKTVENWLKINLNMLQMTIQGLEVQRAALAAVKAMSQHAATAADSAEGAPDENPFAAAMWPWNLMQAQPAPEAPDRAAADKPRTASGDAPRATAKPRPRAPRGKSPGAKK